MASGLVFAVTETSTCPARPRSVNGIFTILTSVGGSGSMIVRRDRQATFPHAGPGGLRGPGPLASRVDVTDTRSDAPGVAGGRVALVAGATRGAGRAIAVELGRAGFHVYATGRSSRTAGPSEIGRPETIEETGDLISAAGGAGSARVVDHEDPGSVADLVAEIEREHGQLDVLVNDIFGGDRYMEWDKPLWEHDWAGGLRMLQMGVHTHLITAGTAIPLMLRTAED